MNNKKKLFKREKLERNIGEKERRWDKEKKRWKWKEESE